MKHGPWVSNEKDHDEPYQDIKIKEGVETVCTIWIDDDPVHDYNAKQHMRARLIAAAPDMLADLRQAAATLRQYETLHRAKGTTDSDAKAEVNGALAARFEATIAKATGDQA